jgi:hypothetical protein
LVSLGELGQSLTLALVLLLRGGGVRLGGLGRVAVDAAPARHEQHRAARAEHVLGAVIAGGVDRRLDPRVLLERLRMERRQEPPDDQIVDPPVIGVLAHLVDRVALGVGRDDRVVVGHLCVVDDARERQHVQAGHVRRRLLELPLATDQSRDLLDLRDHVSGQVARVRARIGERLVLLVETLGGAQRPPRGEAEP